MTVFERFRKPRPPAELTAGFDSHERTLAWGETDGDAAIVATNLGLWLPEVGRLGWHEIDKASWRDDVLTVTRGVEVGDSFAESRPVGSWRLVAPGQVPKVVHSRVTNSVALTEHVPLGSGGGVRIVGRRVPGQDGLAWTAHLDPGISRLDPVVQAEVTALLERARDVGPLD